MTDAEIARLQQQVEALTSQLATITGEPISTNGHPPDDPDAARAATLAAFNSLTGLHDLERITQRGRDPETARYTLHLAGDRQVRIGTIKVLWSQAELAKVLAVAIARVPQAVAAKDWRGVIGAVVSDVVEVEETPDEAFEDTVADWLGRYADRATNDHQEAAAHRQPFIRDGELYISATDFAQAIRRQWDPGVKLPELRQALADLGYRTTHVSFERGRGKHKTRSSASYYHGPHPAETEDQ